MANFRFAWRYAARLSAMVALATPQFCLADYASMPLFGPGALLILGGIMALPSAGGCVLAEAILPRRRLPTWLAAGTAVAAITAIALAFFGSASLYSSGPIRGSLAFAWLLVPPSATLALRGALSDGLVRLAVDWAIAFAALAFLPLRHINGDLSALIIGGTAPCLLLWTAVVLVFKARRIAPDETADFRERSAAIGAALSKMLADTPRFRRAGTLADSQLAPHKPAQTGLIWWVASACVLYFGIGAAISAGKLGGGDWLYVEWQYVADLFGLPYPKEFRPEHVWWLFGLPWSLFAGSAFWGLAGLLGGFDPGRARIVRFAAIVFGGALLVWTASIFTEMAETNAREEQASGIHR